MKRFWKKAGKVGKIAGEIAFPRRAEAVREIIRPLKTPPLKTQPTAEPTRKVKAVGVSGVVAVLIVIALARLGVEVDSETATAVAVSIISAVAYLTKSREGE